MHKPVLFSTQTVYSTQSRWRPVISVVFITYATNISLCSVLSVRIVSLGYTR